MTAAVRQSYFWAALDVVRINFEWRRVRQPHSTSFELISGTSKYRRCTCSIIWLARRLSYAGERTRHFGMTFTVGDREHVRERRECGARGARGVRSNRQWADTSRFLRKHQTKRGQDPAAQLDDPGYTRSHAAGTLGASKSQCSLYLRLHSSDHTHRPKRSSGKCRSVATILENSFWNHRINKWKTFPFSARKKLPNK